MKIIYGLLSLLLLLPFQSYGKEISWFKRAFCNLNFEEACIVYETPRKICHAVKQRISYRPDMFEEWTNGEQIWKRGYGDCEDFVIVISDICSDNKISTEMYLLYPENGFKGHMIIVGGKDKQLWFASNGNYYEASSFSDIKKKIIRQLRWKNKKVVMKPFDIKNQSINILLSAKTN